MTANAAKDDCRVVVFARAPEPGKVKTRLIPALGEAGAAELQRRLALHAVCTAVEAGLGPVELWCAPDDSHPFFADCEQRYGVSLHRQGDGDLGARMQRAFSEALARAASVLLVGSDIPEMTPSYLRDAGQALRDGHDVVLGPAEDGGYVLIGLARCEPALFRGIEWGGATVLAETRRRIAALNWRSFELPTLWDVDRPEDLARLPRVLQ